MKSFLLAAAVSSLALVSAHNDKAKKVKTVKAVKNKKGFSVSPIAQTPVGFTCPDEYILEGQSCTREIFLDLVPYCINGQLHGDECLDYTRPAFVCPRDSILIGSVCSQTLTADHEVFCPPGYTQSLGKHFVECTREIPQEPRWVCPIGTEVHGDMCVSYSSVEAIPQCPEGTVMEGEECLTTRVYDCTPASHGKKHNKGHGHHRFLKSAKSAGKDKKGKKVEYVAAPTVVTEVVSQQCEEVVSTPATPVCPEGSEHYAHGCRVAAFEDMVEQFVPSIIDQTPPTSQCPAGFSACGGKKKKSSGGCCRTEETPAEQTCPPGFYEEGLQCVQSFPAEYHCAEPGYSRHGDQCISRDITPAIGEYTVTYQCEGYECGVYEPIVHGKAKGHAGHAGHGGHGHY